MIASKLQKAEHHLADDLSREQLITHTHTLELFSFNALLPYQQLAKFLTEMNAPNLILCSLDLRKEPFFPEALGENRYLLHSKEKA